MDHDDVERIARKALRELGVSESERATVAPDDTPGDWRIDYDTVNGAQRLRIKCGAGTSPQWVREQIFDQVQKQR